MGLFDKLFNKDKTTNNQNPTINDNSNVVTDNQPPKQEIQIDLSTTADGYQQYEFLDTLYSEKKFYNSTRLIIMQTEELKNNQTLCKCAIYWHNDTDCVLIEDLECFENVNKAIKEGLYKKIFIGLDFDLLQSDPEYQKVLIRSLLTEERVLSHLSESLQDKRKCGNYMGYVAKQGDKYVKASNQNIALKSHNSQAMVEARRKYFEDLSIKRQNSIAEKQAKIKSLQEQIDDLNNEESGHNFDDDL